MHADVNHILHAYGYVGVFLVMFLEVAGIPSVAETALIACGIELARGTFAVIPLLIVAIVGNMAGSTLAFFIGRYFGRPILARYGRFFALTEKRLQRAEQLFYKWGFSVIVIGKWIAGVQVLVPYLAGIHRMRFVRFCAYNFVGTFVWVSGFLFIGQYLGRLWRKYHMMIDGHRIVIVCVVMILIAILVIHIGRKHTEK